MKLNKIPVWWWFAVALVCIMIWFHRLIYINTLFFTYDLISGFGFYWKTDPQHCSAMKYGFTPVMPLEYYGEFNEAIYPRIPVGDNTINREQVIRICDRNLRWLQENARPAAAAKQIPVLRVTDADFKSKVIFYVKNNYPFVMRGVNLECFENMRFDKLMGKIGDNKVYMSPNDEKTCPDNVFTEFKNIVDNKCYITNSTNMFYRYDDLLPDSDMDIIKDIIDGIMNNDSKQMFVGVTKGSGTALHAAYTNNFYLMIQGEKKWTFFNPNQLALLYPNFQKKGIYMASQSRFLKMDISDVADKFPLIKYAERYEIDLKERDILYNPMSWFHSVYNKTAISVACSTRWSDPYSIPEIHMLRYGHMVNQELRDYVKDIYTNTGVIGISQIDEHKHMIGENDPDAIPYWDKYTNDSHKLCLKEDCRVNWHIRN